ncbi:hypothetical protein [Maricaulis sp.]|uniref:hypothetical protein n=1 Tax=Maricaulis sp. TaxID=1486257 RepID=UPI00260FD5E6|nr:hypothetical protein [Maricaulis sp.]
MTLKSILAASAGALALAPCALADTPWTYDPEDDAIGRIYYYERSNTDGSLDERITIFRRDATHIEVYKENGLCRNASVVRAELDLETLSAPKITGGQLQPNAEIFDFAFLQQSEDGQQVDLLVQLPDMEIRNASEIENRHWVLFDFDFASMTVATPHLDNPQAGFGIGLALLWADPSAEDPFFWMGDLQAEHVGEGEHLGVQSAQYRLTGSALDHALSTGDEGQLWLDARDGHIVDIVVPAPSHPGYTDYRLRLLDVSDGGEPEWTALLTRHFEDCQ